MTLKTKLISSISAFVLVLAMLIVGVWAATQANIAMGGTINFQATNVYAKVSATVSGMEENPTLPTLIFSEGADASSETDVEKWSNLDLLFNSSATPIEISVTVENLSTERWLLVDIIEGLDNGKSDNINKEVKKENSDYTLGETHTLVPSTGDGTSKVEFTITLTVDNSNYSADTIYSYIINLNNSNEAPPEPAKELDFTFSGNKVTGYTGNETNITIPTSYSMEKTPYNSFVLTMEEIEPETSEARNKMAILYALKNYTVYLNGQSEGVFCENGFKDFMSLMGNPIDPAVFPLRVELPEDLTFELTEEELGGGQGTEETEFKLAALELLQNFYVKFGNEPEEICLNYDDFMAKLNEKMPDGPNSTYFPIRFRINNIMNKYFEGDDYQVEVIGNFSLTPSTSEPIVLTIPSEISIDLFAFSGITHEFSIVFEEGWTEIGMYAFYECISLTSVSLPSTLISIGDYAFLSCSSLTSISIPEGVTEIGDTAFSHCISLTSVSLPSTLTSIGFRAFLGCSSLEAFNGDGNEYYTINDNRALLVDGGKTLLAYAIGNTATSYTIPEGVTSIGDSAFYDCSSLTSVSLPNTLSVIDYSAFDRCRNLTSIIIPEGVTSIGRYAFSNCSSLTSVSLPSTLTSIVDDAFNSCYALAIVYNNSSLKITAGSYDNGDVGHYAEEIVSSGEEAVGKIEIVDGVQYYVNKQTGKEIALAPSVPRDSLISVTIREGTTEINQEAFDDCSNLTSITIPEGVTSIGGSAFYDCSSLTSVSLPSTLTSIGYEAFRSCYVLAIVYNNSSLNITAGSSGNGEVALYAKEIVSSGEEAVGKIEIVDYVQYYVNEQTGENIALAPSVPRDSLTSITIREGTIEINQYAFSYCTSLTSITIKEGVTSIGERAFWGCSSLTSISIPEGVTSIGEAAFAGCSSLAEITINGNISTLDSSAFVSCSNLTKLTLGSNVTSLPDSLFGTENLTNLTTIVVEEESSLSAALPAYGTWVKDGGSETVINFSGPGTYTKQ